MPGAGPDDLVQRSRVEPAEIPRQLAAQHSLGGKLLLDAIPPPVICAGQNANVVGNIERRGKALACRDDVDFDAIAGREAPVERHDLVAIALPLTGQVRVEMQLYLI